jgi:hypothetical protein
LFTNQSHILFNLGGEELLALAPLTNFLAETKPEITAPLPELQIGEKRLIPPAADLSNIGFGEWCFAYQAYHYHCASHDEKYLDQLIAVLYRPADPAMNTDRHDYTGDLRYPFNENLIQFREKEIAPLPFIVKQGIHTWFCTALLHIMANRDHLFPETLPGDEPDTDSTRTWFTVFRELLGPKWGTEEKLKHTNALFVLDSLEEAQIEYLSRKANS